MTDSENSLRILNALPGRIIYKGNYYFLNISKTSKGKWVVEYQRITMEEIIFKIVDIEIGQAAFEMYELLIENKLI